MNNIPKLNGNIINKLSSENKDLYNKIVNFLSQEYKSLDMKINSFNSKKVNINNLNSLTNNIGNYRYKDIFKNIYDKELQKSMLFEKDILNLKNILNIIKNDCESLFKGIDQGLYDSKSISEKFKNILQRINNINIQNINEENKNETKSISVDKYGNIQRNNYINKNEDESQKKVGKDIDESKSNGKKFFEFYNFYNPNLMNNNLNTRYSHRYFNYKKNDYDIKFKIMSSEL